MSPRSRTVRGGFTLVELLVAISVVATVAVVGIAYGNGYRTSQNNVARLSDVDTLRLAADSYFRAKGDYPEPTGNRIFYDTNGSYAHSSTGAYGVSSTATSDLFGAEFLADVPTDPDTGNAYGYGKRKDGTAGYDFAAVDRRTDSYYAYVRGTYDGSALSSLVREYNGPGFVEDGKTDRLPYNPLEKKITAKIASYAGAVTVSPVKTLTGELVEGDTIKVPVGGYAVLHVSDGSEARIGSATSATELKLENLSSKDSKGFLTQVRFALNGGEVWTKAPKLREDRGERSEIEIVSGNAVASVRGTVFGVAKTPTGTDVTLAVGQIALTEDAVPLAVPGFSGGIVTVADGGTPQKISIADSGIPPAVSSDAASSSKLSPWGTANGGTRAKLKKLSRTAGTYTITFVNSLPTYSRIVVPLSKFIAGGSDVTIPVSGSGIVRMDFIVMGLPAFPDAGIASTMLRLPLRFENDSGAKSETEIIVPATADFELDEDTLPQGWGMSCPLESSWFLRLGCQPKTLRAYAPYDKFDTTNTHGDLNLYDRNGQKMKIATDGVSASDVAWVAYPKSFDRNPAFSVSSFGFRTTSIGVNGTILDKNNRDDFIGYDLSKLDIPSSSVSTMIDVGVQLSALQRGESDIDHVSGEPDYGSETRRAYLWSLADGTALYYQANDAGTKSLVLENSVGPVTGCAFGIPANFAGMANQKVKVSSTFYKAGLTSMFKVQLYLGDSTSPVLSSACPASTPTFDRMYVGGARPKTDGSNLRFDSQWGGKSPANDAALEPIDYVKIYSAN